MVEKVYKIIDEIDASSFIKKLSLVKESIINSEEAKILIKNFNEAKMLYEQFGNKEEFIKAKKEMLQNELIKEYVNMQNEINLLTLQINNNIKKITNGITKK